MVVVAGVEVGVVVGLDVDEVVGGNSLDEAVFVKHFDVSKSMFFNLVFVCQFCLNKLSYD